MDFSTSIWYSKNYVHVSAVYFKDHIFTKKWGF